VAEKVEVRGLKEIVARLDALPSEIAGGNKSPLLVTLRRMASKIAKDAQSRVPVKTGTLKDNIIASRVPKRRRANGEEAVEVTVRYKAKGYKDNARNRKLGRVGGDYKNYGPLFYAKFLEFGTSKMQARPFLTSAFEANKGGLPEQFKTELSRAIDEAVKKLAKRQGAA
jgi:HK97 gp10 family phage protein